MNIIALRAELCEWASGTPNTVAIGLVGSHARGEAQTGSDIDLIVIAEDPKELLTSTAWVLRFGQLLSDTPEDYGLVQSLRCRRKNGTELEFGITSRDWCNPPIDPETACVIRGGLQVIFDPEQCLQAAQEWVSANP